MKTPRTPRVGVYLRISLDPDGTQTATERQRADCIRFASSRDWEVVDVFEDIDVSAYQKGAKRAEFQRMLQCVRDKHIDGVLAWKIDRLTRRMRDFVLLDEACEDADAFIATVIETIDTRTPTGRFVAELLVAQARMESENTSVRQKRKHVEIAEKGAPLQGGHRIFGYRRGLTGQREIVPEEAVLVREARDRLFAGESVRAVLRDWNERGVRTTKGNPWRHNTLSRLLRSSALSGQREHRGVLTPGTWQPIISPADTRRLRVISAHRTSNSARSYLLSGLLRCGRCERPMWGHRREDQQRRYVCPKNPGTENCGRMARMADPVEDLVKEAVFVALDGVDLREYARQSGNREAGDLAVLVRADEEALEEWARELAEKRISPSQHYAARDVIESRLEQNRRELAQASGQGLLASLVGAGDTVREQWDDRGLDWQRSVIATVIDHIVIMPAVKGRNTFDPSLVRPVWRF